MAGGLKTLPRSLLAAALAAVASLAYAQGALFDPTCPPATAMEPTPASAGASVGVNILQTVILRKGHKPVAVINGVMVELGGKLGDATLVELSESEAVLQGPSGKEALRLTPTAEKSFNCKPPKGADKTTRQTKPGPKQADHD